MKTIQHDANHKTIYLNYNEYNVTFRNLYGYEITVACVITADMVEAEEQARLALDIEGHNSESFETIKIERI